MKKVKAGKNKSTAKKGSKTRAKKLVIDEEQKIVTLSTEKAAEALEADESLFFTDTMGSKAGLPKARKTTTNAAPAPVKHPKVLSEIEAIKVSKAGKKLTNFTSHNQKKKVYERKQLFDLWGESKKQDKRDIGVDVTGASGMTEKEKALTTAVIQLKNTVPRLNVKTGNQLPQKVPYSVGVKEGKDFKAVALPTSGMSVNPGQKAFDDAVEDVLISEVAALREEEETARRMKPMTAALLNHYSEEEVKEMDEAEKTKKFLELSRANVVDKDADTPGTNSSLRCSKTLAGSSKLTRTERNKLARQRSNMTEEEQKRAQKDFEKTVGQAGSIMKEIQTEEKARQQAKLYKEALKAASGPREVKIGRKKFDPKEFKVIPKKVESGLRQAGIGSGRAGSALMERVVSMQRRGMVELPPTATRETLIRVRKNKGKQSRAVKLRQVRLGGGGSMD